METEKLYYTDPFLRTFTATVLDCQPREKGGYSVVLDRTAFYPEGGGQPADHGVLNGAAVTDVQEKNGVIFHNVEKSVQIGETVSGILDWERRFDHMQQHSGEHILSGILCADYHCDNVGFHMGADTVTIDYNTEITYEQALDAQWKANRIIAEDLPVEITYPSREALSALAYRSKKELTGQVRIVTFPGADCCACCGTHVLRAGQVGLVKVLSCQKFREGVRMEIVCGFRALRLLDTVYDQSRAVAQSLSVHPDTIAPAVARVQAELADTREQAVAAEREFHRVFAQGYQGQNNVLVLRPPMRPDSVRRMADAMAQVCSGTCAVFAGPDPQGRWSYALVRADQEDISALVKQMNQALSGRGGGRSGFAQGSAVCTQEQIRQFFNKAGGYC